MTALEEFNELRYQDALRKNSSWQRHWMKPMSDKTANGLTRMIMEWCRLHGYMAARVNSMGIPVDNRIVVQDVTGQKRIIGSKGWRPSGSTKGAADLSLICNGKAIEVEIKIGKDRQSPAQKEYQRQVEQAGGTYLIARTFTDFVQQIKFILNYQTENNLT